MNAREAEKPKPKHVHRFDPVSGWCASCPTRDDMRLVVDGVVWQQGRSNEGTKTSDEA